jgi:hypothetical protein
MASKLDQVIAKVALEVAGSDPAKMMAAAAAVAPRVTAADAAVLPERWYPKITSKAAGAPQLRDAWPRAWFEAVVEVLCQMGAAGLPALFQLLERDGATYHEMVVLRLLRMAAAGTERAAVGAKLAARLPNLHRTQVYASVREVVFWSERDPGPLEVLRPLAKLKVKDGAGDSVGTYIKQFEDELAMVRARRAPQTAADPLNEAIVAVAALGLEPERFREQAAQAARALGPSALGKLVERLKKPDLATLKSRVPPTIPNHEAIWQRALMEILSQLGAEAIPAAQSFLDDKDAYIRELSVRLLCLLAVGQEGAQRAAVIGELRKRVPRFAYSDVRDIVARLAKDASTTPGVMEVLDALGDAEVTISGNRKTTLGEIVKPLHVPPPPKPASRPEYKQFRRVSVTPWSPRILLPPRECSAPPCGRNSPPRSWRRSSPRKASIPDRLMPSSTATTTRPPPTCAPAVAAFHRCPPTSPTTASAAGAVFSSSRMRNPTSMPASTGGWR